MSPPAVLNGPLPGIVTITLNPAIDHTVTVPHFTADAVNRVAWEQADPGGKGINVSSFLADFGIPSTATGFLGQENRGLFQQLFSPKGIGDRCVPIPGKTRVNIKIVDPAQHQVTDINFPGLAPTATDLEHLQGEITHLMATHDWFILAGSLPAGVPPEIYRTLTQQLKQQGKTVVLDTSGPPLAAAIAAHPDLIKPNREELQTIVDTPLDSEAAIVQAARDLIHQDLELVVVSLGAAGALFVNRETALHAQPPAIEIKSTVGAGDAMVAGTVAALVQGLSLEDCARLGTAFSLGALTQIGPRLPPKDTLLANCAHVTLRAL